MRTMLVEADYLRHSRRVVHSHQVAPNLFFLSPEWSSCVHNPTLRKEKLARGTPKNLSLRSCSKILQMRNGYACFVEYGASA